MIYLILKDLIIIFSLSVTVLVIGSKLRIPSIVGYLITGILAGPYGFKFLAVINEVEVIAEIGVVLLLFTIGIEFSFRHLKNLKKIILLGGSLQAILTIAGGYAGAIYFGASSMEEGIFIGFLITLSSTAIVLKVLQEQAGLNSPHGKCSLGILVFQDFAVVPMMILIPLLAGVNSDIGLSLLMVLGKGLVVIAVSVLLAKWVVPFLMLHISKTRNREIFLLSIIVICFSIAWVTHIIGLSLALGAFLAGLIISESDFNDQALSNVLPFRDVFTSFFFISIGMLLNTDYFFKNLELIAWVTSSVILIKIGIGTIVGLLLRFPIRTAILVGITLSQIGEFSFILAKTGLGYGVITNEIYQLFLSVSVLTMAFTPIFIFASHPIMGLLQKTFLFRKKIEAYSNQKVPDKRKNHTVIIGYGTTGQYVARASKMAGVPYEIIEMNADTVQAEKKKGEPIHLSDATKFYVLEKIGLKEAHIMVIAITDPDATRQIVEMARNMNPDLYIIVRVQYLTQLDRIAKLGVDEVVTEDIVSANEIVSRILKRYLVPDETIAKFSEDILHDDFNKFQPKTSLDGLSSYFTDAIVQTIKVKGSFPILGKTISEINMRKNYQITLLAIRRDMGTISNPQSETIVLDKDLLVLFGKKDMIDNFHKEIETS